MRKEKVYCLTPEGECYHEVEDCPVLRHTAKMDLLAYTKRDMKKLKKERRPCKRCLGVK